MTKVFSFVILIFTVGCSYSPIKNINYDKYNAYSSKNAGNQKFKEIGIISVDESDFIYTSCNTVAEKALEKMIDRVKSMNGNAIMNLKWESETGMSEAPHCRVDYGWFGAYIIGGFVSPWVTNVELSGIAIDIKESNANDTSLIIIDPKKTSLEMAKSFIAEDKGLSSAHP